MVTVRYFAGAKEAAGIDAEDRAEASIAEVITGATAEHGTRLGHIMSASSFLVDGTVLRDHHQPLPAGCVIDVLPPFAGG